MGFIVQNLFDFKLTVQTDATGFIVLGGRYTHTGTFNKIKTTEMLELPEYSLNGVCLYTKTASSIYGEAVQVLNYE